MIYMVNNAFKGENLSNWWRWICWIFHDYEWAI